MSKKKPPQNNKQEHIKTLDLHGFRLDQVDDAVDRLLVEASNKNWSRIRIMTGKGSGAVRTAVINYLKLAHYQWEYERLDNGSRNEGSLIIFVT